jgi:hypothetical protein
MACAAGLATGAPPPLTDSEAERKMAAAPSAHWALRNAPLPAVSIAGHSVRAMPLPRPKWTCT